MHLSFRRGTLYASHCLELTRRNQAQRGYSQRVGSGWPQPPLPNLDVYGPRLRRLSLLIAPAGPLFLLNTTMPAKAHHRSGGGIVRTHSRTSSTGSGKAGLGLQLTQKEPAPPRYGDKQTKRNSHLYHEVCLFYFHLIHYSYLSVYYGSPRTRRHTLVPRHLYLGPIAAFEFNQKNSCSIMVIGVRHMH